MNVEQKLAWFTLITATITVIAFGVLLWWHGLSVALAAFAILSVYGFTPLFFHRRPGDKTVLVDERDQMFSRQANVVGGMISYVVFVLACMAIWLIAYVRGQQSIAITLLPLIVFAGALALLFARSITLLILYHRDGAYGEG